jgi:hypothetical protein
VQLGWGIALATEVEVEEEQLALDALPNQNPA